MSRIRDVKRRPVAYLAVSRRPAAGLPFNAVSTVPVSRRAVPDDARKDGAPMNVIAYIRNDFQEKFGIPRQSGVVETLCPRLFLNRPTGVRRPCGDWKVFPISG